MTNGSLALNLTLTGKPRLRPANSFIELVPPDIVKQLNLVLAYGAEDGQMNLLVMQQRGLQAGASETLNLYDGSILDVFGDAAAFRALRWFIVWVTAGGGSDGLTVGNAAANPHLLFMGGTTPTQTVYEGGLPFCAGGKYEAEVSNTVKNVKLLNNSATDVLTYWLFAAGSNVADPAAGSPMGDPMMPLYA